MENKLFKETRKKWTEIGRNRPIKDLKIELSFYKKMLDIFQLGDFYHLIFYPAKSYIEQTSENITNVLGYTPAEFTTEKFLGSIHPADVQYFVEFESKVVEFKKKLSVDKLMKYKSQYFYRLKRLDGTYIPILQQSVTIQVDEDGTLLRNLVIHTDISTLRPSLSHRSLSFIGLEGEPSFYNVQAGKALQPAKKVLTKREEEILTLLSHNKTTAEIAEILCISQNTVSTHRKNIFKKTNTHSVLQLVTLGLEQGWI